MTMTTQQQEPGTLSPEDVQAQAAEQAHLCPHRHSHPSIIALPAIALPHFP